MSPLAEFVRSERFLHASVFLVAVFLRGIPELLVSWYPVGYETITYYAPPMFTFSQLGFADVFFGFFRAGPLLFALLWLVRVSSGAHPYLVLKMVGPLLYGVLAVSFLLFLRKGVRLNEKMALAGTLLLVFQVAALRESWDRFRTVLGLIFAFAALTTLKTNYRHKWWLVGALGALAALSREYVAFVLFVSILGYAFLSEKDRMVSFVALVPALVLVCLVSISGQFWWVHLSDDYDTQAGYNWAVQDVFSLVVICFLPILPFVVKGYRKDRLLDPILGWLLLGAFSVVVAPWFAVPGYQRWLMLLVFPFTIHAVRGFDYFHLFNRDALVKLVAVLLIFALVAGGYCTGTISYAVLPNSWVPTSLVQSSIPWDQVNEVQEILGWVDENVESDSCVLSEERFYGWILIYLGRANEDIEIIPYGAGSTPLGALGKALDDGFRRIYLIWYSDADLDGFLRLHSQGSVSVFRYEL